MREGIRITAGGIIERDVPRIVRGLTVLGFIARDGDHRPIETVGRFFIEKYRDVSPKSLRNLSLEDVTRDLGQIFSIGSQIQIPNDFILVWRTAGILNGLNSRLDPDINIIEIARPYAVSFIEEGERGFLEEMLSSGKEVLEALAALPKLLEEFLRTANRGEVKTRMSSEDVTGALDRIRRLLSRAILAAFSLALWGASLYLDRSGFGVEGRTARILAGLAAFALVFTWIRRRKG
jgi:predicted unusual protein kinase regulating ubiquinone biosynthesis (AarF/ABC1/UbiB family)